MKSKIKIIARIGVMALCASCTDNEQVVISETADKGLFDETISHDNLQREYLLYVPETYTGNEPLPLVFSLHGAGGTKEGQYGLSQFHLLAERENFMLVTPQATSIIGNMTFWNQQNDPNRADDVGFIDALIDEVASRYTIDLERVYLAGSSNGAFMALEITCQLSQKIAATAAVKGYMLPDQVNKCNPTTPTAIIQMHGTEDPLVPYGGVATTLQFWAETNQTAPQPMVSNLPDTDQDNGNTVVSYLYNNGINGVEIEHLEVIGGGHDWFGEPGTNYDINASEKAWEFFNRFDSNGLR